MNSIQTLSSILGLSLASGVNLYAAVLVVGLGERYGWIGGLPGELHLLANPIILIVAGVMYFLEFFADKIPFVSVAWDTIHTVIRPLGGAALALASAANMSPLAQAVAFLAGGSIALGSHSTKLGYRLITHASPEPVSNSVFSLAEDFGVVGLVLLVYKHPQVAIGVAIVLLVLMALIAPFLFRAIAFVCSGIAARISSLFARPDTDNVIPAWLQRELKPGSGAWKIQHCFVRSVPAVSRLKRGYLAVSDRQTVFASKGVLGAKVVPLAQLELRRGLIFDLVAARAGERQATIYLTKDRAESFQPIALATS